jgi:hypothetical protein
VFKYNFGAILNSVSFIHNTSEIRWKIIEKFDPNTICTFLEAGEECSWFMKILLVSCINTVYICTGHKICVIFYEVYQPLALEGMVEMVKVHIFVQSGI